MSRKIDQRVAQINLDISNINSQAARDIAILNNDSQTRIAAMQANTAFQTSVLQTLGSVFQTGMQSYLALKAEERKQEKENRQWAASYQLALAKDAREATLQEAQLLNLATQNKSLELEVNQKKTDMLSASLYDAELKAFVGVASTGNEQATLAANAQLLSSMATQRTLPDGSTGRIPLSEGQNKLYMDAIAAAREFGMELDPPDLSNAAQQARNEGLAVSGDLGNTFRAVSGSYAKIFDDAALVDVNDKPAVQALVARIDGLNSLQRGAGHQEIWAPAVSQAETLKGALTAAAIRPDAVEAAAFGGTSALANVSRAAQGGQLTMRDISRSAGSGALARGISSVMRSKDPVTQTMYQQGIAPLDRAAADFGAAIDAEDLKLAKQWAAFSVLPEWKQQRIMATQPDTGGALAEARRAYKDITTKMRTREEGSTMVSKPIAGDQVYYYSQNMAAFGRKGTPEYQDAKAELALRRAEKEDTLMKGVDLSVLQSDPNTSGMVLQDSAGAFITKGTAADLIRMGEQGLFNDSPGMLGVLKTMRDNARGADRDETFPKRLIERLEDPTTPKVVGQPKPLPKEWTERNVALEQDVGAHAAMIAQKAGGGVKAGTSANAGEALLYKEQQANTANPVEFSQDGRPGRDTATVTRLREYLRSHPDSIFAKEALAAYDADTSAWTRIRDRFRSQGMPGAAFSSVFSKHGKDGDLEAFMRAIDTKGSELPKGEGKWAKAISSRWQLASDLGLALRATAQGQEPFTFSKTTTFTARPVTTDTVRAAAVDHAADELLKVYQTTMFNREDGTMRELRKQSQRSYAKAMEAVANYKATYPKMAEITDAEVVAEVQRRVQESGQQWLPQSFQARITGVQNVEKSGRFNWFTLQMPANVSAVGVPAPTGGTGAPAVVTTVTGAPWKSE